MSRYASETVNAISPYVPGEQPRDKKYIKLNTNENPNFTSPAAVEAVTKEVLENLKLYSDPECKNLVKAIADYYKVSEKCVMVTNGSDEALAFAFMAYGHKGLCFADVTYGFYEVLAGLFRFDAEIIKLKEDFTINSSDYFNKGKTVVIANPNAQTGIALSLSEIENIVKSNPNDVVIVDQAYVDFGGENAVELLDNYENLLLVNTYSKSRSLAGARVGFVLGNEKLIEDLNKVRNSFHPYNVNSVSALLAERAIKDESYFKASVNKVIAERARLTAGLDALGFSVLPSSANFVAAQTPQIGGKELYLKLKERGILVRSLGIERIKNFIRITVGSASDTDALLSAIKEIIKEKV